MNTQRVVEGHTQLPWTLIDEGGPEDEYRYGLRGADRKYILSFIVHDCTPTQENMQFIVHACNNIERLEKVNEALVRALQGFMRITDGQNGGAMGTLRREALDALAKEPA